MRPFSLLALVAVFLVGAGPARAADLKLVRVWHAYREAEAFTRISEYFTGQENTRRQDVLRSQPATREGYYFLARIENTGPALPGAQIELKVVTPTAAEPKTYTFKADVPSGTRVIQAGLTGADWPDPASKPVAWSYRVLDASGKEQVRAQSFLWSSGRAE